MCLWIYWQETFQPSRIRVDDAMIVAIGILAMKMVLAAIIEAIADAMGEPDTKLRQCPLAMDTWSALIVAELQFALGLLMNLKI